MSVLLITSDLMTASQVGAAAGDAGVKLQTADSTANAVMCARETESRLVVLDLSCRAVDVSKLVSQLQGFDPPPKVIAFGPHVHVEKLKAARAAGCDEVLTRGQFYEQMSELFSAGDG